MAFIGNTPTTQAFTPAVDYFNGNGSTVAFTLSRPVASVAQVQAVVENVPQKPGDAYTVSGNTITFTSAPPSGTQNIYVYYTSPITQVIAPSQGTVGTAQLQDNAVITQDIADGAVTDAKITAMAASKLTGDVAAARITNALNASGTAPIYACRAWVNFNGTGTVAIRASGNVTSITDNGTGDYTVNFTTAMPDANYSVVSIGTTDATTYTANVQIKNSSALAAGSVRIDCYEYNNAATKRDPVYVLLSIFR